MIRHLYEKEGVRKVVLGSGGSAFCDGGFGAIVGGLGIFKTNAKLDFSLPYNHTEYVKMIIESGGLELIDRKMTEELEIVMPCDV